MLTCSIGYDPANETRERCDVCGTWVESDTLITDDTNGYMCEKCRTCELCGDDNPSCDEGFDGLEGYRVCPGCQDGC